MAIGRADGGERFGRPILRESLWSGPVVTNRWTTSVAAAVAIAMDKFRWTVSDPGRMKRREEALDNGQVMGRWTIGMTVG